MFPCRESREEGALGDRIAGSQIINDRNADDGSAYGSIRHGTMQRDPATRSFSSSWSASAVSSVTIAVTALNPVISYSKIMRTVRILGLITLISYMTVILLTWICANAEGYVYFSAGEPERSIKYSEWVLGATGILVALNYLWREISDLIT